MSDSPSPNIELQKEQDNNFLDSILLAAGNFDEESVLAALDNLSLTNLETRLSSLHLYQSQFFSLQPVYFLPSTRVATDQVMNTRSPFFLSAKPDYFVTSSVWSEQGQNRVQSAPKHHDNVIQELEHRNVADNNNGGNVRLPQYIFQLGRLIYPGPDPLFAYKLPFVAVVDVLDPRKAVWLVHVEDITEDPEEGQDWYPPRHVPDQIPCLFDVSKQRDPVYHITQVAPSLREWMRLDWDAAIDNMKRTCRRGAFNIKVAREPWFGLAINEARNLGMAIIVPRTKDNTA